MLKKYFFSFFLKKKICALGQTADICAAVFLAVGSYVNYDQKKIRARKI